MKNENFESRMQRLNNSKTTTASGSNIYDVSVQAFYSAIADETGIVYFNDAECEALRFNENAQMGFLKYFLDLFYGDMPNSALLYELAIEMFALWNNKELVREKWKDSLEYINQAQQLLEKELQNINNDEYQKG